MKFGTKYQEALVKEEFPVQWLDSAISYKKLKKCIKRVREELLNLGLDHETLEALWQHVGTDAYSDSTHPSSERMLRYQFTTGEGLRFVPKLTIALDPRDGSPMDAWLSPETRRILQKVGKRQQRKLSQTLTSSVRPDAALEVNGHGSGVWTPDSDSGSSPSTPQEELGRELDTANLEVQKHSEDEASHDQSTAVPDTAVPEEEIETIEIPLTSDSEFFQILRKELQALENLQTKESSTLTTDIVMLGKDLQIMKSRSSKNKYCQAEIDIWREIFRLYIESEIFMSNHEQDAGVRSADAAATQLQYFLRQLTNIKTNPPKPKSKEAHIALERFVKINSTLLRLLKFQELNRRALGKILKKFDKKTSLHALPPATSPDIMLKTLTTSPNRPGLSTSELSRSLASVISTSLLSLIPQLDDYLCPVCMAITYKPVRLRCNHVFCIRCMIRMQRLGKDECPLCREHVVLEATEENLDKELKKFLKKEFRAEVDEKKKDDEIQAGKEMFGDSYDGTARCEIM